VSAAAVLLWSLVAWFALVYVLTLVLSFSEHRVGERDDWREKAGGWRACAEDADGVLFVKRAEAAEADRDRLRDQAQLAADALEIQRDRADRLARRVTELEAALREIVDRHMRPCGVHEVPLPCDVALAETYAIAAEALDVQEGGV
jgi:hypothetical protein